MKETGYARIKQAGKKSEGKDLSLMDMPGKLQMKHAQAVLFDIGSMFKQ